LAKGKRLVGNARHVHHASNMARPVAREGKRPGTHL